MLAYAHNGTVVKKNFCANQILPLLSFWKTSVLSSLHLFFSTSCPNTPYAFDESFLLSMKVSSVLVETIS